MLLSGSNGDTSSMVKLWLAGILDMKDLREVSYILGIILHLRCNRMLGLSLASFIDKILEHFSGWSCFFRFMCPKTQEEKRTRDGILMLR